MSKISSCISEYLESVAATDSNNFSDEDYSYQRNYDHTLSPWDWEYENTESRGGGVLQFDSKKNRVTQ